MKLVTASAVRVIITAHMLSGSHATNAVYVYKYRCTYFDFHRVYQINSVRRWLVVPAVFGALKDSHHVIIEEDDGPCIFYLRDAAFWNKVVLRLANYAWQRHKQQRTISPLHCRCCLGPGKTDCVVGARQTRAQKSRRRQATLE